MSVHPFRCSPDKLLRVSEIEFCGWIAQAAPGDAIEYHRGVLMVDRVRRGRLPEGQRQELVRIADRAMWAAEHELVHLVQRRHGPDDYSYMAIARPSLKQMSVSLSQLMMAEVA